MTTDEARTIKAIKEHILTPERFARKDIAILIGRRDEQGRGEGFELRALSYMDVILESKLITEAQLHYGKNYWSARDTAFHFLQVKTGKLEYRSEDDEAPPEASELAEEGFATELYLALRRRLDADQAAAINACCNTLTAINENEKLIIVRAFGEKALRDAFKTLEKIFPEAKEDAEARLKNQHRLPDKAIINNACNPIKKA